MDRSWGVAGAASLTAFFTVVMMMNSGFFYVALIEEFGVTRESASWPMSVMSVVAHSSGCADTIFQHWSFQPAEKVKGFIAIGPKPYVFANSPHHLFYGRMG
ncbi:hypothetical protein HPB50_021495 [Hyalomma asiaticum]|uniref:Uncharacterized protein n=1 Tax=Hyalomma asiaticum TaxID=266040 RepID=A0ACB7SHK3_HYAAI|nr:hypothetical protein HPB50_021495 [Hyalomma asiaticum]